MKTHQSLTVETLEARLTALLPQEYQDSYEDVEPVPMGSAGLKYSADGTVAWDEIWQSFCDLAMAGGPPHKGQLLEPAPPERIGEQPDRYQQVAREICRGVAMVTGLPVEPSSQPGWITVACDSDGMAGWLLRAVVMENVSARADEAMLDLPAGPDYRIDKEIKNVVTVIAKTCHYWSGHMWRFEQRAIGELFAAMSNDWPLVVPAPAADLPDDGRAYAGVAAALRGAGLTLSPPRYRDWIGIECPSVRAAVWMMRMLVACNVLSRREDTSLFVPVNAVSDPGGAIVSGCVTLVRRYFDGRQR